MGCLKKLVLASFVTAALVCGALLLLWIWLGVEIIPNQVRDPRTLQDRSFDYIIVGAGTAGCVLANRLSENPNVTVLLVEAGDTFGSASIIPLISTAMQGTKYDWAFRTTPQKYSSHGLGNNQQLLPRGKGLGGSGQINYMLHFTGIPEDFDRWERLGARDWNWRGMKPYLDKLNHPAAAGDQDGDDDVLQDCKQEELTGEELYENYFDHLNLPLFVSINATASVTMDKVLSVDSIRQYLQHGRGVLSTTAIAGIGSPRGGRYGIILFGMGSVDEQALRHVSNMEEDTFRAFFPSYQNTSQEGFLFLSTCHQPASRGGIFLRDRHIDSVPFFNPNYLKDRSDIGCMIQAIRLAARTVRTDAFRSIGAHLHWPHIKRCSNFGPPVNNSAEQPSDRYLECILRTSALTGHHPGGTAAIGLHSEAVVDNQLRVNGVHGLRVVDASVFPAPVSGTPNSVLIAVAEKASDLILQNSN
uniref:Glucose-methanol-choline oxidoreductase N-terminal domain-containing protein n=1 Tax=Anopheles stephensi TaxID=30069 RepID=A0A182YAF4_ANOST